MSINLTPDSIIACICEGGAETAIMDILLDNDLLIFQRQQLIDKKVIRRTSAKDFQRNYLSVIYDNKIVVFRVLDSHNEKFPLDKAYKHQVEVINVVTAPEIEMLIVISENQYDNYCKSNKKPSDFCKQDLNFKNVKKPEFVRDYFSNTQDLVDAIKKYNSIHERKKNESTLYDLLKS